MKMTVKEQVKSKGMLAGWGLVMFGIYLIVEDKSTEGFQSLGIGLGVLGIRDA